MMTVTPLLFYFFAALLIFFAYKVITSPNPVHCALYLVMTMIGLAAAYFQLNAQFIAGVQLIVYAGAVMVLFVMVLMLFDLEHELTAFSKGLFSALFKIFSAAMIAGYLINTIKETSNSVNPEEAVNTLTNNASVTRELSILLYSKYLLAFEVLGVLLLVVAVGVVTVSRVRGGTHAKH
ncbi:MAG: NADH-quinone oxidoreductase subunit J [Bdellovibrionales bacterium]